MGFRPKGGTGRGTGEDYYRGIGSTSARAPSAIHGPPFSSDLRPGGSSSAILAFRAWSSCSEGYPASISQVDVTDPNGVVREVKFNERIGRQLIGLADIELIDLDVGLATTFPHALLRNREADEKKPAKMTPQIVAAGFVKRFTTAVASRTAVLRTTPMGFLCRGYGYWEEL
ncbi:MAG TPA: hypothetical protein VIY69_08225 [Candidatus Acidoferrales bacterium]